MRFPPLIAGQKKTGLDGTNEANLRGIAVGETMSGRIWSRHEDVPPTNTDRTSTSSTVRAKRQWFTSPTQPIASVRPYRPQPNPGQKESRRLHAPQGIDGSKLVLVGLYRMIDRLVKKASNEVPQFSLLEQLDRQIHHAAGLNEVE